MPCQRHRGMIVVAGLMNTFLGTSLLYSAGIIHFGLLGKYRRSPTQVSWASALFSSTFFLAGKESLSLSLSLSLHLPVCLLCCLPLVPCCLFVWSFSSHPRIFTHMETTPLPVKGCQFFTYARLSWTLSSEGSKSHTRLAVCF